MISERIKEARLLNNITQTELAKKLGITRSSVNAWEMGISVPSTQYLIELSKTLKVSTDYLLGLEDSAKIEIGHLAEFEKEIVLSLIQAFEDSHEKLLEISEQMKDL